MYKRYSVILRHFEGYNNKTIAQMEDLEPHAVGNYIKNYTSNGLAGLEMKKSTGAKRKFSIEQETKICEIVTNNTSDQIGFEGRKNWTIEIIRQWAIKEFNSTMSHRGMAEVLYRLNLSYTRPTYVLAKADKEKQNDFDFNSNYKEQWQENMAFKLQEKVSVWIQKEKVDYKVVMDGNEEIFNFQLELYREHEEDTLIKQLEIDEKTKFQKSIDDYFNENEDKHNW